MNLMLLMLGALAVLFWLTNCVLELVINARLRKLVKLQEAQLARLHVLSNVRLVALEGWMRFTRGLLKTLNERRQRDVEKGEWWKQDGGEPPNWN